MNDPSLCRLIANPYLLKPIQPPVNYSQKKSKEYIQMFLRSEYKDLYITESLVDHISIKIKETLSDYEKECIIHECLNNLIDSICKEQESIHPDSEPITDPEQLGFLPLLLPDPESCENDDDEIDETLDDYDETLDEVMTCTPHSSPYSVLSDF